jgi:thiamine kinase-like enzyme
MRAEDIARRLWPGRELAIEPLGGGITNHNFRVQAGDETFVLRIGGRETHLLGIDRGHEEQATRVAAAAGVGPEVCRFLPDEACLVTRFIRGRPVPVEEMRSPRNIARVAAALRRIHDGPPVPGEFDAHRVVTSYRDTAAARGGEPPADYDEMLTVARRIAALRGPQPAVPCHNDLLNANFLDDGEIRIVDWEYAGMGDRFFDLANFAVNHELDTDGERGLLEAYFGEARAADLDALHAMRFMSDFREAMWGVVQGAVSELDFDFAGYAAEHFARMRRTAEAPAFRAWLDGAAAG